MIEINCMIIGSLKIAFIREQLKLFDTGLEIGICFIYLIACGEEFLRNFNRCCKAG